MCLVHAHRHDRPGRGRLHSCRLAPALPGAEAGTAKVAAYAARVIAADVRVRQRAMMAS
jgi:hypothetical protein